MKSINYLLTLFTFFMTASTFSMGLGDWQNPTPGHNTMEDPGNGITLRISKTNIEIFPIEEWYFYKDYIIGKTNKNFFIVNENNGNVLQFESDKEWTNFINHNDLKPLIWTRWYSDNWVDNDSLCYFPL